MLTLCPKCFGLLGLPEELKDSPGDSSCTCPILNVTPYPYDEEGEDCPWEGADEEELS